MAQAAAAARDLAQALASLAEVRDSEPASRDTYDSEHLPPRTSRRRFTELCRSGRVVGAFRDGRHWVCSHDAWRARRARPTPVRPEPEAPAELSARAQALLRRSGLRPLSFDPTSHDDAARRT
jgi:hypothetical protein